MRTSRHTQIEISFDQAGGDSMMLRLIYHKWIFFQTDSVTTSTATSDESHRTSVGSPPLVGNASIQWPMEIPRPSLIYKPPLYDGTEYHVIYTGSRVGIFGDWYESFSLSQAQLISFLPSFLPQARSSSTVHWRNKITLRSIPYVWGCPCSLYGCLQLRTRCT